MRESTCPRCSQSRQLRDGPYFVCTDCRWCWTVSITGKVYVQSAWPPQRASTDSVAAHRSRRLLASIDGLDETLAATDWPEAPARTNRQEQQRLERARAAIAADFYNEGLPLAQLRAEGVFLPPAD